MLEAERRDMIDSSATFSKHIKASYHMHRERERESERERERYSCVREKSNSIMLASWYLTWIFPLGPH
jgi:hypothetical protein